MICCEPFTPSFKTSTNIRVFLGHFRVIYFYGQRLVDPFFLLAYYFILPIYILLDL